MPFPIIPAISWKFTGQPYDLNSVLTPDQVWAKLDLGSEEVRQILILYKAALESITDNSSGADNLGATAITDLDGTSVQALLESIRSKLKAITTGSSGADFVAATAISGLSGTTVQALLESLKSFADTKDAAQTSALNTHRGSADHDGRYFTETESDMRFAPIAKGVTNGDGHDHNGGDGAQIDHANLVNKGINTHAQIDIAMSNSASHIANALNPHNVTAMQAGAIASVDGVSNHGGNVDFVGGTGITITPNNTTKTVTITATGTALPAPHASTHAAGGTDEVTPASIGAETPMGTQARVDNLAGAGRTTETVKGTADNLNSHLADNVQHITSGERTAWNNKADQSNLNAHILDLSHKAGKIYAYKNLGGGL